MDTKGAVAPVPISPQEQPEAGRTERIARLSEHPKRKADETGWEDDSPAGAGTAEVAPVPEGGFTDAQLALVDHFMPGGRYIGVEGDPYTEAQLALIDHFVPGGR